MNIYLVMIFGGILGIVLHSFKAVRDINKRTAGVNFTMVLKQYWTTEYLSIFASIFCFGVLLFIASEFINMKSVDTIDYSQPIKDRLLNFKLSNFIKLTSVLAGYFSDSLVYGFLGKTEQKINDKINEDKN